MYRDLVSSVQGQDVLGPAATAEDAAVGVDELTSAESAMAPLPESRLGPDDFQVLKVVGQGAFGKVRVVQQPLPHAWARLHSLFNKLQFAQG